MTSDYTSKRHGGGKTDRPAAIFLDTTGNPTLGIGICARCSFRFALHQLSPDPNAPGLLVCSADKDDMDPYRMSPRPPDVIQLPFVRPDVPLDAGPNLSGEEEIP